MDFTTEDFTRRLPPPPPGWRWSGWRPNGTAEVLMKDAYLVSIFDTDEPVAGDARMHILLAAREGVYVPRGGWEVNEAGGVSALSKWPGKGFIHTRILHLDFSQMPDDLSEIMSKQMRKAVGRKVHLAGDMPTISFRTEADTDAEAARKNGLYNFQGFEIGCQCMLMYPRCLTVEPTAFEKLKAVFS